MARSDEFGALQDFEHSCVDRRSTVDRAIDDPKALQVVSVNFEGFSGKS